MVPPPDLELDGASWHEDSDASLDHDEQERRRLKEEQCAPTSEDELELAEPAPTVVVPQAYDASESDDEHEGSSRVKVEMSEPLRRKRRTGKQPVGCTLFPPPEMPSKPAVKSLAPKKAPKKRAKPVGQAQQAKRAKASATSAVPADDVTDAESPKASGTMRAVPADDVTYAEIEAMPLLQIPTGSVITIEIWIRKCLMFTAAMRFRV